MKVAICCTIMSLVAVSSAVACVYLTVETAKTIDETKAVIAQHERICTAYPEACQ